MSTLDPAMSYVITEFDPRDAEPMIALWTANLRGYDRARAQAKLRLGYVENPAGGSVLLALLADGTAAPQGSVGLNARRMHLGPRCIHAVTAVDFVVNIEHRSKGLALRLLRECARIAAERLEFCYGMPNANAAPAFARTVFGGTHRYGTAAVGTTNTLKSFTVADLRAFHAARYQPG